MKDIVSLPYVKDFSENKIPIKARPIQMNIKILDFCQKEIADLLAKGIIRKNKSPWSCAAFYVKYPQIDAIVRNVKELAQAPRAQFLSSNSPPMLLTPDAFLPPVKETTSTSNICPPASSSSSKKKSSKSKKKKKVLMKAFLDSLNVSSKEDEEDSKSSSNATIDP